MRLKGPIIFALISLAALALVLTGCGGSGSSSTAGSTASSAAGSTASSGGDTEASAEFAGKSAAGKLATRGKEAGASEREAASQVLEESLQAREAGDWAGQCATFTAGMAKQVGKPPGAGAGKGCVKGIELLAAEVPESVRASTIAGPISALRVEGNKGWAFYHGTKGKDYVYPLEKEGGEWKVTALLEEEVP